MCFLLCLLPLATNIPLSYKILSKKSLRNVFNVSLGILFGVEGILGAILILCYFMIVSQWMDGSGAEERG